jgi:hypothetical protein
MTPSIESKYNHYYAQHCKHLKLKGLQPKTIECLALFAVSGVILTVIWMTFLKTSYWIIFMIY